MRLILKFKRGANIKPFFFTTKLIYDKIRLYCIFIERRSLK